MIREKENNKILSENVKSHFNLIKGYFEKKNAICHNIEKDIYEYTYVEEFRNNDKQIWCNINLINTNAVIKIFSDFSDDESNYEVDNLFNRIFSDLFQILLEGHEKYVIRVYGRYFQEKPFCFKNSFKWKNNVNVYTYSVQEREYAYNVEQLTSCPKEQVLYCDIEVEAYNLSAARSKAYNLFMEFITFLSVLLDIGIQPFTSKENVLLVDFYENDNCKFVPMVGSSGIYDSQLDVIIFDNMNGLIGIKDTNELFVSTYLSIFADNMMITKSSYNEILNMKFKNRELEKISNKCERKSINIDITYYNAEPELVSEDISFYRKIASYETQHEKEYSCFYNACKLYNNAHFIGADNPTVMISYFVASIEALSKTENKEDYLKKCKSDMEKFVLFCEKYYVSEGMEFDKDFIKYLYGNIRSGHFHSGEFLFMEYNCNMDLSMDSDFFGMQNVWLRARKTLRNVIVSWIRKNILEC